jgi:hypothetical protein
MSKSPACSYERRLASPPFTDRPYVFSGTRLAFGSGWRVSLVTETLGSSSGIGYRPRTSSAWTQCSPGSWSSCWRCWSSSTASCGRWRTICSAGVGGCRSKARCAGLLYASPAIQRRDRPQPSGPDRQFLPASQCPVYLCDCEHGMHCRLRHLIFYQLASCRGKSRHRMPALQ